MKRAATIAFYVIGTLAILYLALYAYAVYKGRTLQPGDPIHIFRNPDAPDYSCTGPDCRPEHGQAAGQRWQLSGKADRDIPVSLTPDAG